MSLLVSSHCGCRGCSADPTHSGQGALPVQPRMVTLGPVLRATVPLRPAYWTPTFAAMAAVVAAERERTAADTLRADRPSWDDPVPSSTRLVPTAAALASFRPPAPVAPVEPAPEDADDPTTDEDEDDRATCDECGDRIDDGDVITWRTRNWRTRGWDHHCMCESCADRHTFVCDDCNERFSNDDGPTDVGGSSYHCVCNGCLESYSYCDECECWYDSDDYRESREHDHDTGPIRNYSDRTASDLGPFGDGPVYYGVELEVESDHPGDDAETYLDRMGGDGVFAVAKEDASIENGFELVTAPASLTVHRERWHAALSSRVRGCKSWDTRTCGMHVHVSREPLTELQVGKVLVFVNADENSALVNGIAGRTSERWAARSPKKLTDASKLRNRYQAVNLTNDETIEFRIFRGTLRYESVIRNLEFVAAVVAYCGPAVCGPADLTTERFARWVAAQRATMPGDTEGSRLAYPALVAWLRLQGYLPARRAHPSAPPAPTTTDDI